MTSTQKTSYIIRHWRGDYPLSIAYWANNFCITIAVTACGNLLFSFTDAIVSRFSLAFLCFLLLVYYVLLFLITIWQCVGLWRSANKYNLNPKASMWGDLAKFAVIIGILNNVTNLLLYQLPQSKELFSIVLGDKGIPPFKITVLPGGKDLLFKGGIRAGSAAEFKKILQAVPQASNVQIDSIGGRISEAKRIGEMISERGMSTYCSSEALSAATLILMNGKRRYVTPDAKIGFHAGNFPGATKDMSDGMDEDIRKAMKKGGVSEAFIKRVLATPHSEMWYPTFVEMQQAKFISGESFGEGFASSLGLPNVDLEKIFEEASKKPHIQAFKTCAPGEYAQMKEKVITALRSGKSEVEAISIVNEASTKLFLSSIPYASDKSINNLTREMLRFLKEHMHSNAKGCIYWLKGTNVNFYRVLPEALTDSGIQNSHAYVITSAMSQELVTVDQNKAELQNDSIFEKIHNSLGEQSLILAEPDKWEENAKVVCRIFVEMYSLVLTLDEHDSANYMRWALTLED